MNIIIQHNGENIRLGDFVKSIPAKIDAKLKSISLGDTLRGVAVMSNMTAGLSVAAGFGLIKTVAPLTPAGRILQFGLAAYNLKQASDLRTMALEADAMDAAQAARRRAAELAG